MAWRPKNFKLIHFYYDVDEWELYDRKKDPLEVHNVFHNPAYADTVAQMKEKLKAIRKKYKDSDSLSRKYIQVYREKGLIED